MKQADILTLLEQAEQKNRLTPAAPAPQRAEVTAPPVAPLQTDLVDRAPSPKAPVTPPASEQPDRRQTSDRRKKETRADIAARNAAAITVAEAGGVASSKAKDDAGAEALKALNSKAFTSNADAAAGAATPPAGSWHDQVPVAHGGIVRKGLLFVFGFLGIFFAWALLFPIDSAVVAEGKVVSDGQNKLVQHYQGGVITEIFVADGDQVTAGDPVARIDDSAARATVSQLMARRETLEARKARFDAEHNGQSTLVALRGGQEIVASDIENGQPASAVFDQQKLELDAGRKRLAAQVDAVEFQIETFKDQRSGLQARLLGGRKLLQMTQRELDKVRPLAAEGYIAKSRLWELEKTQLEQLTSVENTATEIDAMDQRIAESEARLAEVEQSDREKRSEQLTSVIGELAEIKDQIKASETALALTTLRAPVSGTVVNLKTHTKGGVIEASKPIAEIVPVDAELETEFRVPQQKAKHVYPGQDVRITVTTFNQRTYAPIEGKVSYMSADTLQDPQTGENYFLARAKMTPDATKKTGIDEVSPGMATQVFVLSEPRVFASYVMQPLIDSFNKAFRESN